MAKTERLLHDLRDALDDAVSLPLYQQLAGALRSRIASGDLSEGDRLPTEQGLSKELGIGVSTVRAAYSMLVDEGLVVRRAGKGSFVSSPHLERQLGALYNFTTEIRSMGMTPTSRVLDLERTTADPEAAKALRIGATDEVFVVQRLRCADGSPLILEQSTVPVFVCPGLTREDVESSLYEAIARHDGWAPSSAHEVHEAVVLDEEQAGLLGRAPGMPAFRITRTASNANGMPVEYSVDIAPGDRTRYVMELSSGGVVVSKTH